MVPVTGLLLIQPLSGDGRAPASDLVRKEEEILPSLGRADLLKPIEEPAGEVVVPEGGEPVAGGEEPDPQLPVDVAEEGEAVGEKPVAGMLPDKDGELKERTAGDGPGIVEGVVADAQGAGIPGVIITLPDQNAFQVMTGDDGRFRITGLPAAGVSARFIKAAYLSKDDVFQVKEEGVTKVFVALELKPVELAEGEYLLEGEEIVLDPVEDDAPPPGITTDTGPGLAGGGLSKEFLSKSGASDAAGAVEKISGANIVGGKFVVVRGLGDRYNNTTLNGGIVPSPETSRKAVQLDLFPSNALEGVAIQKNASPSLPADFVGGLVQLQTLTESKEDFFNVSVGTTFDQLSQNHGEFFTVRGLDLSSNLKSSNPVPIPTTTTRASGVFAQQERQAFFDAISFKPRQSDPEFDRDISASFSKSWELSGNSSFSLLGTIGRNRQQRYREMEQSRFQNAIGLRSDFPASDLNPRFADLSTLRQLGATTVFDGLVGNFVQESYTESEELSMLLSGSLNIGENLTLNGTFFNFRSGNATYTLIDNGVTRLNDFDLESESDALARGQVYLDNDYEANSYRQIYDLIYRELQFGQVGGTYRFDDWREGALLNWNAYHSETGESSPRSYELRGYFVTELNNDVDPISGITLPNPANLGNPNTSSLIQFDTFDESTQYKVDGVLPIFEPAEDRKVNLIAGFGQYRRTRDSSTVAAIIANGSGLTTPQGGIDATDRLLNDQEVGISNSIDSAAGFIPGSAGLGVTPAYRGSNDIESFYLGLDGEWDHWLLRGGLRFEEETRSFVIPGGRRDITQTTVSDDFYPSLELGKYFGSEKQVKLALNYSETVVRPTFYEFIPARILDLTNQRVIVGNRELRETQAKNFDFSLTWKKENNYAGINVFHKIITDPIFTVNDPSGIADRTFVNLGETEVSGVELEASYEMGGGFSVTGNVSFIETTADPGVVTINRQDFLGQIDRLEGQPNLLGNVILSWENNEIGLSSNLIYNYTGEYLTVASLGFVGDPDSALPNEIRKPFHSLDWNLTKEWETDWADYQLKFQVRNILNSEIEVGYEGLASTVAPAEAIAPGREFGVSFQARF